MGQRKPKPGQEVVSRAGRFPISLAEVKFPTVDLEHGEQTSPEEVQHGNHASVGGQQRNIHLEFGQPRAPQPIRRGGLGSGSGACEHIGDSGAQVGAAVARAATDLGGELLERASPSLDRGSDQRPDGR